MGISLGTYASDLLLGTIRITPFGGTYLGLGPLWKHPDTPFDTPLPLPWDLTFILPWWDRLIKPLEPYNQQPMN